MKNAAIVATLLLAAFSLSASVAPPEPPLQKVEPARVCMINEQYMEKEQIPVTVDGKTYYGCCEMCKERLAKDASKREAIDPVSGKTVDKARAVIGAAADGRIAYFESEENLARYNAAAKK
jgi:YHS domain-containing protein